jgi:hypothetical protein
LDDSGDVAGSASPVERPAFLGEVPPLVGEDSVELADRAPFPPLTVDELATGVEPLMGDGIDGLEIGDSVVELVAVDVVDLLSGWDGSEVLLPGNVVLVSESAFVVPSEIALAGDVIAVCSGGLWSCLSHDSGFTVLQLQYTALVPRTTGSLSARSALGMMKKRE